MTSNLMHAPKEFLQLFKAGKDAARAGNNDTAHELFRKAIEIDPYHEQVWLWLASVVNTDEDRRVCFENVLELNPSNPTARRQLNKLEQHDHEPVTQPQRPRLPTPPALQPAPVQTIRRRRKPRRLLFVALIVLVLIIAGLAAALLLL